LSDRKGKIMWRGGWDKSGITRESGAKLTETPLELEKIRSRILP
jgi:hypothetical protein